MMKIVLLLISLILFSSCMKDEESSLRLIEPLRSDNSEALNLTSDEISGTGRFIFDSVFKSNRVNTHIILSGQFLSLESQVTLHLFFDSFKKDTGIQLKFSPEVEDIESIAVYFAEPSRPLLKIASIKKSLAQDNAFKLRIETQNKVNNGRRILIWNDSVFYDSDIRVPRETIFVGNADYDSLSSRNIFYSWGSGIRWGASVDKVKISELRRSVPYVNP